MKTYVKELARAAWAGMTSAGPGTSEVWPSAAVGAGIGTLAAALLRRRRIVWAFGPLIGGGAGAAWASRRAIVPAARAATQRVGAVRDARWLAAHPIDYA